MRILVTNDDGIDAPGLHALTKALCGLDGDHEIVVVAPNTEYSGAGASLGALHLIRPILREASIPGCSPHAVWSLTGPPALCVMFSRLGAFGPDFDLIVSGINPGANVGRAVYHSGTVGATLTGRNGMISGVAVSQAVSGFGVEGQAWEATVSEVSFATSARIGAAVAQSLLDDMPEEPVVINVNVPELPISEMKGWRHTTVGLRPPRTVSDVELVPIEPGSELDDGDGPAFRVDMRWGERVDLDERTDGGAIEAGFVSISNLSRIVHEPRDDLAATSAALDAIFS